MNTLTARIVRRIFLVFSISLLPILSAKPVIHLYVLEFDNLKGDPTIDWLSTGFTDMVNDQLGSVPGVVLKSRADLEHLMNNRSILLHQTDGTENLLLLGKYTRELDNVEIGLQIVNVANWEEVDQRKIDGKYSEIPLLSSELGETILAMIKPWLPQPTITKIQPEKQKAPIRPKPDKEEKQFPGQKEQPTKTEPTIPGISNKELPEKSLVENEESEDGPYGSYSKKITYSIDKALDDLEESMDLAIGAREKPGPPSGEITGEWSLDLNVDHKYKPNPENQKNTELLRKVLDNLINRPYTVNMDEPHLVYDTENDESMRVVFPVTYSLKESIIKDMLTSLPYSALNQDGTLTIFSFEKDNFNFPPDLATQLQTGAYRAVPVIQFFDDSGKLMVVIVDTPDAYWHGKHSENVLFIPTHKFSPLIDFTMGGWTLQIAMESIEIPARYSFFVDMDQLDRLDRVTLKFIPEEELYSFLSSII